MSLFQSKNKLPSVPSSPAREVGANNMVTGSYQSLASEQYYKISNSHLMDPFFMSLVSATDHWMFIASNGALTCGRKNANSPIFPYYSSDKILDCAESTGTKTIIRVGNENSVQIWEPFSTRSSGFSIAQNIYKNVFGSKLHLEEVNKTLGLVFRYSWSFSEKFGFVKTSHIANLGRETSQLQILDGFQNLMPSGLDQSFQLRFGNLANAYKKNELCDANQFGIFYLSSVPTDRAEPNEGLQATVAWQTGLANPKILLSNSQLDTFRCGEDVTIEKDVRGRRGAFFCVDQFELPPKDAKSWKVTVDTDLDQAELVNLQQSIRHALDINQSLAEDIKVNDVELLKLVSAADGIQVCGNKLRAHRHCSNVLFNLMRGGTPRNGYSISTRDFAEHLHRLNHVVFAKHQAAIQILPPEISCRELAEFVNGTSDANLIRIGQEYLPLFFSRRHGDPTRPWNVFTIDVKNPDGTPKLNYEGNWRDIFQNWEALSISYPHLLPSMVMRFVNASTADGYNPYRITKQGFDWERPDPEDPWANIGYWGDHQIVYLLKLVELSRDFAPASLDQFLNKPICVYANVPYRIKDYANIRSAPQDTVDYDWEEELRIENRVKENGIDGRLVFNNNGMTHQVTLLEKLVVSASVKMTNLVPDGGIWLNTQRPEWNDANNALVGNGLSVVTVCYLRRYLIYVRDWLKSTKVSTYQLSEEVEGLVSQLANVLKKFMPIAKTGFAETSRKQIVDQLQEVGENYRSKIYSGHSGNKTSIGLKDLVDFIDQCVLYLESTIRQNERSDGLFHSYNLMQLSGERVGIEHLDEMLEGQVAVIESGYLAHCEVADLIDKLKASRLYRADQNSYVLYPDRQLQRFQEKNIIPKQDAQGSPLVLALAGMQDDHIVRVDVEGQFHFGGEMRNAADLRNALNELKNSHSEFSDLVDSESEQIHRLFEQTFQHHRFTGRSSTFFAYEGLGSIYWHMVSKLALAVNHSYRTAAELRDNHSTASRLLAQYREIRNGLGLQKNPKHFGAFPVDPYSHTPQHAGAQQPGMTGQVKEDILARVSEIGVRIRDGIISFDPGMLESCELLTESSNMKFFDVNGQLRTLAIEKDCFAFTLCQVPVILKQSIQQGISIRFVDQSQIQRDDLQLSIEESQEVFARSGQIQIIEINFPVK